MYGDDRRDLFPLALPPLDVTHGLEMPLRPDVRRDGVVGVRGDEHALAPPFAPPDLIPPPSKLPAPVLICESTCRAGAAVSLDRCWATGTEA